MLIINEILKWLYLFLGLGDRIKTKIYEPISSENRQAETFEDFKEIVIPMLLALGPYAYHDGILLYKVCTVNVFSVGSLNWQRLQVELDICCVNSSNTTEGSVLPSTFFKRTRMICFEKHVYKTDKLELYNFQSWSVLAMSTNFNLGVLVISKGSTENWFYDNWSFFKLDLNEFILIWSFYLDEFIFQGITHFESILENTYGWTWQGEGENCRTSRPQCILSILRCLEHNGRSNATSRITDGVA